MSVKIEDIQEEVLTELFGLSNVSNSLWGLFGGDGARRTSKKNDATVSKKADTFQQASGFTSDRSLNDVDIPTYLRQAMQKDLHGVKATVKSVDHAPVEVDTRATSSEKSDLRKTGWKVGPPGNSRLGQVGVQHDAVSASTQAGAEKRKNVYANKSYASIRETAEQTEARLVNEWKVTSQLRNDPDSKNSVVREVAESIVDELLEYWTANPTRHEGVGRHDTFSSALADVMGRPGGEATDVIQVRDTPAVKQPAPEPTPYTPEVAINDKAREQGWLQQAQAARGK